MINSKKKARRKPIIRKCSIAEEDCAKKVLKVANANRIASCQLFMIFNWSGKNIWCGIAEIGNYQINIARKYRILEKTNYVNVLMFL